MIGQHFLGNTLRRVIVELGVVEVYRYKQGNQYRTGSSEISYAYNPLE